MYMMVDIDVPDWANWMAQDNDGEFVFYEEEPHQMSDRWLNDWASDSRVLPAYYGPKPKDWTQELYQIVR